MRQMFFKYRFFIIPCLLLAFVLGWLIVRASPASESDIRRSACFVDGQSALCLYAHGDTATGGGRAVTGVCSPSCKAEAPCCTGMRWEKTT